MGRKKGKQSGHHPSKAANALFWKEHIQDHVVSHSSASSQQRQQQHRPTYPKPRPKLQTIGSLQTLLRMNQQRQHSSMNIFGSSHDSHYGYILTNNDTITYNDDEVQYDSNLDVSCLRVPTLLEFSLMSLGKNLDVYIDHYGEKLLFQIFSSLLPTNVLSYLSLMVRVSSDSIFQFYLHYHHHHYQKNQNYNLLIRCSNLSPYIHSILQKYLLNHTDVMNDGNIHETKHHKIMIHDEREYEDWEERDIINENEYHILQEDQSIRSNHDFDVLRVDKRTFLFETLKRLELHHWNNKSLSTLTLLLKQCPNLTHLSLSSLEITNTNEIMMWWTQILNHLPNKSLVVLDLTNCSWMSPSLLYNSPLVVVKRQRQYTNILWKNDEEDDEDDDNNLNLSFPNLEYIYLYGCPNSCFYKSFQKNIGPKPKLCFDEKIEKPLRLDPHSCILKNYLI